MADLIHGATKFGDGILIYVLDGSLHCVPLGHV